MTSALWEQMNFPCHVLGSKILQWPRIYRYCMSTSWNLSAPYQKDLTVDHLFYHHYIVIQISKFLKCSNIYVDTRMSEGIVLLEDRLIAGMSKLVVISYRVVGKYLKDGEWSFLKQT